MILLTGFEPFGGDTANPSWARGPFGGTAAPIRRARCPGGGTAVRLRRVGQVLAEALERFRPELVLCAGQAGGRPRISLERVAINCDDARIPDNAGNQPVDEPVVPGGPAAYFTSLPVKAALAALTRREIPAEVSQSAGTYVCNHVFYATHARPAASSRHQGRLCPCPLRGRASFRPGAVPRRCRGRQHGGGARRRRPHCAGDDGGSQARCRRNALAPRSAGAQPAADAHVSRAVPRRRRLVAVTPGLAGLDGERLHRDFPLHLRHRDRRREAGAAG